MPVILPIEHLSYSATRTFCANPWMFKKNYILGIWDFKSSPSMVVGKAFHKFAECLYSGMTMDESTRKAYEYIENVKKGDVDWGKTGAREKVVKETGRVIEHFLAFRSDYGEVKATEYKATVLPQVDGKSFPLPVKAVTDLVTEQDGKIKLWDWKTLGSLSDPDEEKPDYIMQAVFNYFTVAEKYGNPHSMTYVEIKKSKSKDGEQIRHYEIVYDQHPEYFKYFGRIYAGIIDSLANDRFQFMPNFGDFMNGKETWADFTSEIMDFNMPAQINHKAPVKVNVDRTFVESKIDARENVPTTDQDKIAAKMLEFGVPLEYEITYAGPNIDMHAFKPSRGVRMANILKFDRDLQLALETTSVRILAPIPGKKLVGVEIPSGGFTALELGNATKPKKPLGLPIGQDIYGEQMSIDLAKAPHLLVAGATGAGKSVALAVFIKTLTQNNNTTELGLILIDPKRSEFVEFDECQHLLNPIITETGESETALEWAVEEMERRYQTLKNSKTRNIDKYREEGGAMSNIVVVIDELADLLLSGSRLSIESSIIRLAQKSRAVGIHLVVATQRPSVDVVTGILKANFPTRLAFMTATQVDSKVILDQSGAEKLIGRGDCLLMQPAKDLVRLQGYFTE